MEKATFHSSISETTAKIHRPSHARFTSDASESTPPPPHRLQQQQLQKHNSNPNSRCGSTAPHRTLIILYILPQTWATFSRKRRVGGSLCVCVCVRVRAERARVSSAYHIHCQNRVGFLGMSVILGVLCLSGEYIWAI